MDDQMDVKNGWLNGQNMDGWMDEQKKQINGWKEGVQI